jgi:hypothetical protein
LTPTQAPETNEPENSDPEEGGSSDGGNEDSDSVNEAPQAKAYPTAGRARQAIMLDLELHDEDSITVMISIFKGRKFVSSMNMSGDPESIENGFKLPRNKLKPGTYRYCVLADDGDMASGVSCAALKIKK